MRGAGLGRAAGVDCPAAAKQLELSAAAGDAPKKAAKTLVETARVRAPEDRQAGRHYGGGAAAGKMRLMFIQTSLIFDGGEGILWKHRNKREDRNMLTITVAQDGSGDFASVSEAVLAVPCLRSRDPHWPGRLPRKSWCAKNRISP
ncbi:MAG: hypothetical protein ACLVJH_17680 [Faecalibacterium prausnitzii]